MTSELAEPLAHRCGSPLDREVAHLVGRRAGREAIMPELRRPEFAVGSLLRRLRGAALSVRLYGTP